MDRIKLLEMRANELVSELNMIDLERSVLRERAKAVKHALDTTMLELSAMYKLGLHRMKPSEIESAQRVLAEAVEVGVSAK